MGYPTADDFARAVIASARVYGDDPAEALLTDRYGGRRSLRAAACALVSVFGVRLEDVCRTLDLNYVSVKTSRQRKEGQFTPAWVAAQAALAAGSKTEAREATTSQPRARVEVIGLERVSDKLKSTAARLAQMRAVEARPASAPVYRPPEPEVQRGPRPAAAIAPAVTIVTELGAQILEVLAEGPKTSQGLATRLDVKESVIIGALTTLERDGKVVSLPAPENATRRFVWGVTPLEASAHG